MKVLFLLPMIGALAEWHQGIASLATYLRRNGYKADLLEIDRFDLNWILDQIDCYGPHMIAATANSHQFAYIKDIMKRIKHKMPHVSTVFGGVHATIDEKTSSEIEGVDAICRGEGEGPLLEYVQAIEQGKNPGNIANMVYPRNGNALLKQCSYCVENLDDLPIADRDLFRIYREADRSVPLTSRPRFLFCRGCPFNCSYCCNKTLKTIFPDPTKYVRWPRVDRVIEEILRVAEQYHFKNYVIDDDIFTLKKKWVMEFCNKYPEKLRKSKRFEINVRIGTVDEDVLRGLKEAGCNLIKIGLESGDESIRKRVLDRNITDDMIMETVTLANKVGIPFHTYNMVGIPGESRKSIWKTIQLNRRIKPDRVQATIYYPYPNTPLGDYCIDRGMVDQGADTYFRECVVKHDKMRKWEIELYALGFILLVYSGYSVSKAVSGAAYLVRSLAKRILGDAVTGRLRRLFRVYTSKKT